MRISRNNFFCMVNFPAWLTDWLTRLKTTSCIVDVAPVLTFSLILCTFSWERKWFHCGCHYFCYHSLAFLLPTCYSCSRERYVINICQSSKKIRSKVASMRFSCVKSLRPTNIHNNLLTQVCLVCYDLYILMMSKGAGWKFMRFLSSTEAFLVSSAGNGIRPRPIWHRSGPRNSCEA